MQQTNQQYNQVPQQIPQGINQEYGQQDTIQNYGSIIKDLTETGKDTHKTINELLTTIQIQTIKDDSKASPKKSNKLEEIWAVWWGKVIFGALTVGGGSVLSLIMEHLNNH